MSILGLKLPTDPRWADIAEKNISEILTDHAYCEQKAASMAISLIVSYPEYTELVKAMAALAREEMSHFEMVFQKITERNLALGREVKDEYVRRIRAYFPSGKSRKMNLAHKLLVAALIEARSCERFKLLSEKISDVDLADFYRRLMTSEANHYTMFLTFARDIGGREEVDKLWRALLEFEASIMADFGTKKAMHG